MCIVEIDKQLYGPFESDEMAQEYLRKEGYIPAIAQVWQRKRPNARPGTDGEQFAHLREVNPPPQG